MSVSWMGPGLVPSGAVLVTVKMTDWPTSEGLGAEVRVRLVG